MNIEDADRLVRGSKVPFHELGTEPPRPPSAAQTNLIVKATSDSSEYLKVLASSSENLEKLTKRLNTLTWVLIILTFFAVVTPIAVEVWKAYHPEPRTELVIGHPEPLR